MNSDRRAANEEGKRLPMRVAIRRHLKEVILHAHGQENVLLFHVTD